VEAAGHYHRPLLESALWPVGWELLELSPARVSVQRRVQGRRRVNTDAIDLEAITELVLAGHWVPITARATITELSISGVGWIWPLRRVACCAPPNRRSNPSAASPDPGSPRDPIVQTGELR
jgi:hypothetical protein